MLVQNKEQARRFFLEVRRKVIGNLPLSPLESVVADVITMHPEWHALLDDPERALALDGSLDAFSNPFLHLSMHVALAEQIGADRPRGIRALMQAATVRTGDPHRVSHQALEVLIEQLAQAGAAGREPDEQVYLERLKQQLGDV